MCKCANYPCPGEAGVEGADVGTACAGKASESKAAKATNTADTHKQATIPQTWNTQPESTVPISLPMAFAI